MIEELSMAAAMSVVFALLAYYFCELQGSFFVVWLVWLISLADGIGALLAVHLEQNHVHVVSIVIKNNAEIDSVAQQLQEDLIRVSFCKQLGSRTPDQAPPAMQAPSALMGLSGNEGCCTRLQHQPACCHLTPTDQLK